jgi:hypothetical protein
MKSALKLVAGRPASFLFDLQQFNEVDDALGDPPQIDVSSLSDDPAVLKRTIGTLIADNKNARKEAIRRRSERDTLKTDLETEKAAHVKSKADLETDLTKHKADLETANRSNGQLRGKFREQFVDAHVRTELEKRGAKNVDDAMKLLDVSKIEFDEEKLTVKDAAGLTTTLDTFVKEREYLFGTPSNNPIRGTSLGRGASDTGTGGGDKNAPLDKNLSPEAAMSAILGI